MFLGLYDLRKDKPYVMVTSPGSPEHLASNPTRILRASKSVTGPNSLHVGGKIQVTTIKKIRCLSTDHFVILSSVQNNVYRVG